MGVEDVRTGIYSGGAESTGFGRHIVGGVEAVDTKAKQPNWALGLIGAAGGAVLGYVVFFLLAGQGFYAMVLPVAAPGLGGGILLRGKSVAFGIGCAILGVALGVFIEWRFSPFVADPGFIYFITHLHNLSAVTLMMIGIGGLCGFWFGMGRDRE